MLCDTGLSLDLGVPFPVTCWQQSILAGVRAGGHEPTLLSQAGQGGMLWGQGSGGQVGRHLSRGRKGSGTGWGCRWLFVHMSDSLLDTGEVQDRDLQDAPLKASRPCSSRPCRGACSKARPSAPCPGCPKGFMGAGGEAAPTPARGAVPPRVVMSGKPHPHAEC